MPNTDDPTTARQALDDERRVVAGRYVDQVRAFRVHAAVFAGSMAIIILTNLLVNLSAGTAGDWGAWWSLWALLGWGIGLCVHGLVVRLARPHPPGRSPRERQVDEILSRWDDETST